MLQSIPNPVYLFQGIVLRRGAKGTGMKSIELALSMCDIVDIYGFTVDPGYTEWSAHFLTVSLGDLIYALIFSADHNAQLVHITLSLSLNCCVPFCHRTRYFSTPRKGHNPLQGRAYYQLLECLGVCISCFKAFL